MPDDGNGTGIRIGLLGPVLATGPEETELALGSAHRRAVLAILALSPGRVVSRDELIDGLWGEAPPASATGSIHTYISSLRRALGGGRELLSSSGPGYCLHLPMESVDAKQFELWHREAERQAAAGENGPALETFDRALALWRGEPLDGLPGPLATAQRARLAELRLLCLERRAELLLSAGRQVEVGAQLPALVEQHPTRETLRGLLMRALDASGRTDEALAVYEELRALLAEDTGIEPGPGLRELHARIEAPEPETDVGRCEPPPRVRFFAGRGPEIDELREAVRRLESGRGSAVLITGEPGIGKSALLTELLAETGDGVRVIWAAAEDLGEKLSQSGEQSRKWRVAWPGDDCYGPPGSLETIMTWAVGRLRELCAERPVVLVTDDLHWAEETTVLVWRRLAAECADLPLLLAGACRPVPANPWLDAIRQVLDGPAGRHLRLGPLSQAETGDLAGFHLGGRPDYRLQLLLAQSGGNPRYLGRMLAEVRASGWVVADGPEARLADGTPVALPVPAHRLTGELGFLGHGTKELLGRASLLGPDLTLAEVIAVADGTPGQVGEQLDEAIAAGVLAEEAGRLEFRHPVVHQAFYEKTPEVMRAPMHRQLAQLLAAAGPGEVAAGRVATQLVAARGELDGWAVDWLLENLDEVLAGSPVLTTRLLRDVLSGGRLDSAVRMVLASALSEVEAGLDGEVGQPRPLAPRTSRSASALRLTRALRDYWRGDWTDTIRTAESTVDSDGPLGYGLAALVAGHRGRADEARDHLARATETPWDGDSGYDDLLLAATAQLAEQAGRPDEALGVLVLLLEQRQPGASAHHWLPMLVRLARSAGRGELVARAAAAAEAGGRTPVALHCRGLAAGDPGKVAAAAEMHHAVGHRVEQAFALEDAAELLAGRAELDEARAAFLGALDRYVDLGAVWDVRRAEFRLNRFGLRRMAQAGIPRLG